MLPYCSICALVFANEPTAFEHKTGEKHRRREKMIKERDLNLTVESSEETDLLKCDVCKIQVKSIFIALSHYAGSKHEKKMKMLAAVIGPDQSAVQAQTQLAADPNLFCAFCNLQANSRGQYEQHVLGTKHLKNVNAFENVPSDANRQPALDEHVNPAKRKLGDCEQNAPLAEKRKLSLSEYNHQRWQQPQTQTSSPAFGGSLATWTETPATQIAQNANSDTTAATVSAVLPPPPPPPVATMPLPLVLPSTDSLLYKPSQLQFVVSAHQMTSTSGDESSLYCNPCNISLNSRLQMDAHLAGQKHKEKEKQAMTKVGKDGPANVSSLSKTSSSPIQFQLIAKLNNLPQPSLPHPGALRQTGAPQQTCTPQQTYASQHTYAPQQTCAPQQTGVAQQTSFHCSYCHLTLNSQSQMDAHVAGQKHKDKVSRAHNAGFETVASFSGAKTPQETPLQSRLVPGPGAAGSMLFCAFCNVTVNSLAQMTAHRSGQKHLDKVKSVVSGKPQTKPATFKKTDTKCSHSTYASSPAALSHKPTVVKKVIPSLGRNFVKPMDTPSFVQQHW